MPIAIASTLDRRRKIPSIAIPIPKRRTLVNEGATATGKVQKRVRRRCSFVSTLLDRQMNKLKNRKSGVVILESRKRMPKQEEPEAPDVMVDDMAILERRSGMSREELEDFLPPEVMYLLRERPDLYEKIEMSYKLPVGEKVLGIAEARRRAAIRKEEMRRLEQKRAEQEALYRASWRRGGERGDDGDMEEEAPHGAPHYDEVYWSEDKRDMEEWAENEDETAMEERKKKKTVVNEKSMFSALTGSALKRLRRVMSTSERSARPLANVNGCIIAGADLARLKPGVWLNDEIVNAYFDMLMARAIEQKAAQEQSDGKRNGRRKNGSEKMDVPSVKVMNSFFYSELVKFNRAKGYCVYDYSRVRRWTRRFDAFSYDLFLVPINQQNTHWTLGVVNFKDKTVMHLDSMGNGGSARVRENLLAWVRDEASDKKKGRFVQSEWSMVPRPDVPKQQNSDDCGVFICKFADCLTRGWTRFTFDQRHMDYFRSRIAHELLMGKAS